ncbi:MAG: L,D-transpeptidase [Deltaproteobacteria bacterium]|nr:L,D-transpeptidase [Deltaproteobacteria bacterium]MBW2420595.1 L,D-transpeptidase [Deltaproteobacteria bacterium]
MKRSSRKTSSPGHARNVCGALLVALLCAALSQPLAAAALAGEDAGIILELDREQFLLTLRDGRSGVAGPPLRVALGSPARETPAGRYPLYRVILRPSWKPGELGRSAGAVAEPSSLETPMGAVKIPFAPGGYALHGGGDPRVLGIPISSGCVRAIDSDLLRLVAWLHLHGVLEEPVERRGEVHRDFRRPARLIVH